MNAEARLALAFPTGLGQSDTHAVTLNDGRPNPHKSAGTPYTTISGCEIAALLKSPQEMPKEQARWFLPSSYAEHDARDHSVQRERGVFWWLPVDTDTNDLGLSDVEEAIEVVAPGATRLVYATRSSRPRDRRWRALLPLAEPIAGTDYTDTAAAFYALLEDSSAGTLIPDRKLSLTGQLIYLPNCGEHFEAVVRQRKRLVLAAEHPIIRRRDEERQRVKAAKAEAAAVRARRRFRPKSGDAAYPVDLFTSRYGVAEMLTRYGYEQLGQSCHWRSPLQSSGTFATRDYGNFWVSLSGSDAAAGVGAATTTGARHGDAFDLFVHFEHGGDFTRAVRAYAEEAGLRGRPGTTPPPREEDTPGSRSAFYSAATLKGKSVPPRQWLVEDLVPMNTVTLFTGDGGTGKSLLAMQLAAAVAAGSSWLDRPVRPGRAIFLSAEDDDEELHRRMDDILRACGQSYDDVAGLTLRSLAGDEALLAIDTQMKLLETELFKELESCANDVDPVLIVIDTLADVYPANENDRVKVRQFVGILRGLAIRRRCAVMLLGHPSLTGLSSGSGTSGSTAWHNSVRSRLYLERIVDRSDKRADYEPDPDRRVLSTKKSNYARPGGEILMTWQGGVFVPEMHDAETSLDRMAAGTKAERVFLKLLRQFTEQGRRVNSAGGTNYAPKLFALNPAAEGCTKRALADAMERLLSAGKLAVEEVGPPSRRVSHIVEGRP